VTVFAPDPTQIEGFGVIHDVAGGTVSMVDLSPDEVYLKRGGS
jgi:hypothetical protein